jgi:adenylate cyclase
VLGQRERAKDWMNRALLTDPENMNARYNFACTLAKYLNDTKGALDMLGPAFEKLGAGLVNHAKIDPDLDCIRDDPRFKAMLEAAERRLANQTNRD